MHKNTLILVVEDEDEIADILMSYLERSGMKTLRARQGEQAIALDRLHKPDLILLDIHLPVCDGWSVLTTLRQESAVPVIMVSALDQDVRATWSPYVVVHVTGEATSAYQDALSAGHKHLREGEPP